MSSTSVWGRLCSLVVALLVVGGFFVPLTANAGANLVVVHPDGTQYWRGTQTIDWTTANTTATTLNILYSTNPTVFLNSIASVVPVAPIGSTSWDTSNLADGTYYVQLKGVPTDETGTSVAFHIDNHAPITTQAADRSPTGSNGYYSNTDGAPIITLTCDDSTTGGSGCSNTYYSWDGGTTVNTYTAPFTAIEGDNTLTYWSEDNAVDNAGKHNVESHNTIEYKVDTQIPVAPSVSIPAYINHANVAAVSITGTGEAGTTFNYTLSDGMIAHDVTGTGTVDGSGNIAATVDASGLNEGSVTLTVTLTDIAGNMSSAGTASSIKDTIAAIGSITSDATSGATLKIGDTINFVLTPTTTEPGATVSGSYNGHPLTWTTSDSGVTYQATYTVAEGDADQTSPLQITGVTYTDAAGNTSAPFDGTDITDKIDANRPTLSSVSIASSNANHGYAKTGDTATLTFTSSEAIQSLPAVTIDGKTAAVANAGSNNWTATYTFLGGETEGVIPFTVDFKDIAGNDGVQVTATTDSSSVIYDQTAPNSPVINSIGGDGYVNASEQAAAHVVGTAEDGSTVSVVITDGTTTLGAVTGIATGGNFDIPVDVSSLNDGTITVTATATDAAGNTSAPSAGKTAVKDTVAPTIVSVTTKDADANGSVDTATVVMSEPVKDSTINASDFTIGGVAGTTVNSGTADDDTFDIVNGGVAGTNAKQIVYVPGTLTDLAGNPLAGFTQTSTDGAGPVLLSAKTTDTTHIAATFSEDLKGSTLNTSGSEFSVGGFTVTHASESNGVVTLTVSTMPTDAIPTVTYTQLDTLTDLVGNEAVSPVTVTAVDGVAPVLSSVHIQSNNALDTTLAKQGDTVTLTFTASEAIATPTVTIDGQAATVANVSGNDWSATYVMTGTDAEGTILFTIDFEDLAAPSHNAGTQVTATTDASSVLYDRTAPSVDAGTDKDVNAGSLQDATISDSGSGLYTWAWTYTGPGTLAFSPAANGTDPSVNPDATISADTDGTYTVTLTVTDHAGNQASDTMTFIWDTTPPEPLTSVPSDGSKDIALTAGTATVTFDEPVTLVDASRVLLVDDTAGTSYKGTVSIDGSNADIMDIAYTGLAYGTKYRINVKPGAVQDLATNHATSNFIAYFTTVIDTTPPVVTSASAGSITTSGATLSVTTDESSTCRYATTDEAYSSMTDFAANSGTSHTVTLTGLAPSTGYDYYVRCQDTSPQLNAMTTSAHIAFTTETPAAVAPDAPVITTSAATIDADTYTIAGTDADNGAQRIISLYDNGTLVGTADIAGGSISWSLLAQLTQNADNVFTATASDGVGNTSATSTSVTITEQAATGDTTPPATPVITTATGTTSATTYTITGTAGADAPTDGTRVVTISDNGTVVGSISLAAGTTNWSFVSPLQPLTANAFTASSTDAAGNASGASNSVTITQAAAPDTAAPVISSVQAGSIGSSSVTITWTTNEASTSQVEYGITSSYGTSSTLDSALVTSHSVTVTGLQSSTNYHFRVKSSDASANQGISDDNTFATTVDNSSATLAVTSISAVKTFAAADDTYANGWSWDFFVTVPTAQTNVQMKFSDWTTTLPGTIAAASNIRYSSAQASNVAPVEISAANTYGDALHITGDMDPNTPGNQIEILVEARVPAASAGGSYSASYGIQSTP